MVLFKIIIFLILKTFKQKISKFRYFSLLFWVNILDLLSMNLFKIVYLIYNIIPVFVISVNDF